MKRATTTVEAQDLGGHGVVVSCDGCKTGVDYIPHTADQRYHQLMATGELYKDGATFCWRCKEKRAHGIGV